MEEEKHGAREKREYSKKMNREWKKEKERRAWEKRE